MTSNYLQRLIDLSRHVHWNELVTVPIERYRFIYFLRQFYLSRIEISEGVLFLLFPQDREIPSEFLHILGYLVQR